LICWNLILLRKGDKMRFKVKLYNNIYSEKLLRSYWTHLRKYLCLSLGFKRYQIEISMRLK